MKEKAVRPAMTYGEIVADDLKFYIKERIRESTLWKDLDAEEQRQKREGWAIDFLRAKGILESKATEEDKSGS